MNEINSHEVELAKGMAPALLGIRDALLIGKTLPFESPWEEAQAMRYLIGATKGIKVMSNVRKLAKTRLREMQNANATKEAALLSPKPKLLSALRKLYQNANATREARRLGKNL